MNDNDDAAAMAYLKSVTSIKRRCFRKGFVGVNQSMLLPSGQNGTNVSNVNKSDVSNELQQNSIQEHKECKFRLPKRKRKRGTDELLTSEECASQEEKINNVKSVEVFVENINAEIQNKLNVFDKTEKIDNSKETQNKTTLIPSSTELTNARTTIGLEKTRNTIPLLSKILTSSYTVDYRTKPLPIACSPPVLLVESTVSRLTLARERFVFLRGAVEDSTLSLNQLKAMLETEHANQHGSRKKVHHAELFEENRSSNDVNEKMYYSNNNYNYKCNAIHFNINDEHVIHNSIQVDDVATVVNRSTLEYVKELLSNNFGPTERCCWSLQETRQLLTEMLIKEKLFSISTSNNVSEWHKYVELHGPTTNHLPSLSKLVWLSSTSTTMFITVLIQRLLRSFNQKCKEYGAEVEQRPECDLLHDAEDANDDEQQLTNLNNNNNKNNCKNKNNMSCTENSIAKENGERLNIVDDKVTTQQKYILLFLQHLMPTLCDQVSSICETDSGNQNIEYGYGVWLLALCVALDTPLDPDTDRVVHELFVIMCKVIRALGDEKHILGSERGTLLQTFEQVTHSPQPKKYTTMKDVGKEEVMTLYTFVLIFAKFFRQNQDHVIQLEGMNCFKKK